MASLCRRSFSSSSSNKIFFLAGRYGFEAAQQIPLDARARNYGASLAEPKPEPLGADAIEIRSEISWTCSPRAGVGVLLGLLGLRNDCALPGRGSQWTWEPGTLSPCEGREAHQSGV